MDTCVTGLGYAVHRLIESYTIFHSLNIHYPSELYSSSSHTEYLNSLSALSTGCATWYVLKAGNVPAARLRKEAQVGLYMHGAYMKAAFRPRVTHLRFHSSLHYLSTNSTSASPLSE